MNKMCNHCGMCCRLIPVNEDGNYIVRDGFQILELCKNRDAEESIPIIMSSTAGNKDELQAIQLGASHFLTKPYKKETLLYHIQHVLEDNGLLDGRQCYRKASEQAWLVYYGRRCSLFSI